MICQITEKIKVIYNNELTAKIMMDNCNTHTHIYIHLQF